MDDAFVDWFRLHRNVFPVFSVEGGDQKTDERRGTGVAGQVRGAMLRMKKRAVPFGISVTVSEQNFGEITDRSFLPGFYDLGCRLGIFVEYVPMGQSDKHLALSKKHKKGLYWYTKSVQLKRRMLRIVFPGKENLFGGCLAAGRGFVHVSASGDLEPCPFACAADRNVRTMPLITALRSPLLKQLRSQRKLLHENDVGGCALRGDKAQALLSSLSTPREEI
jgi:MoaA/NifB/PqqE/SkfB family radical SAM enzyme